MAIPHATISRARAFSRVMGSAITRPTLIGMHACGLTFFFSCITSSGSNSNYDGAKEATDTQRTASASGRPSSYWFCPRLTGTSHQC